MTTPKPPHPPEDTDKGNPGSPCKYDPNITCDRTDCTTCIQEEEKWANKWTQHTTTHGKPAK